MRKIKDVLVLVIVLSVLSCSKNVEDPGNSTPEFHPPTANFTVSAATGDAPVKISFTDKSTGATKWSWDFGDGYNSTEKNPSHTYTILGKYTVKLTVSNADGSNSKTITNAVTIYQIKEYRVPSVGPFYPKRTGVDDEFGGNGPSVAATATLLPPAGGVSGGSESLRLKLTMSAKETASNWSTAYGEWYINIVALPSNASFKEFLSATYFGQVYSDRDHGYTYTKYQLGEIWTMGDTSGDDICSGGCNTGDTHILFKNFYCKVRIQPK